MVKNNEIHPADGDSRPRLIFSPSSTLKCMGSFVARLLIRLMKEDFMMGKSFVSGVKDDDFQRDLEGLNKDYPVWFSYDGSGHDAHQHS